MACSRLVTWREEIAVAKRRAFAESTQAFTGPCEVLIAEGAGHWPHREAADLFHERLLAFLRGLR